MKLNPPASSSDLDAARSIARRLYRRAQGHQRATDVKPLEWDATVEPAAPAGAVGPTAPVEPVASLDAPVETGLPEPAPFSPEPSASAAPEPGPFDSGPLEPPPAGPEPSPVEAAPIESAAGEDVATVEEELPSVLPGTTDEEDGAAEAPPVESPPPNEPPAGIEGFEESPDPWAAQATPAEGITAPSAVDPASAFGDLGVPDDGAPVLEGLEPPGGAGSPEDLVGGAAESEWPGGSPLEGQVESEAEPEVAPDDLVSPPTPSWDDIVDSCLALARAHGAMLVDPSGQVIAARGDWPEPGPEAIGGRLVSMMEKTLQDAPTRSVSAPLAGRHLTAWRVPASEGYYTVVFMGDAPLGADVRSPVDVEIKQALGQ